MSYVRINDNLFVTEQSVRNDNVVEKRNSVNHIWCYDRSGSMWGALKELTDQLVTLSKQIPKGDTLTIGWFSSEGQRNFMLKGFKISDDTDYDVLEKTIRNNSTTVGLTCFSEILGDTKGVIEDLSVFSDTFSFHFFTDGYPVVSNTQREVDAIFTAIAGIKGKITSAMFVGYGYYYNKELMTKMAEKLGAMLIHSSMVPEYTDSITRLMELSGSASPRQDILPPVDNPIAVFTVTDQGVVVTSVDDETGMVSVSPNGDRTTVYYVSTTAPEGDTQVQINPIDDDDEQPMLTAMYAASLVLTQQMKTDVALEIMGGVGDKRFIDAITNSFTIDEYGATESKLEKAMLDRDNRFVNGQDTNYLPPNDAFCVFDVLSKLMEDDESSFLPYHPGFTYNKVSKPTVTNDDYAKFVADDNARCAMDDLVWNKSRLNLSVRAIINGTIDLKDVEGTTANDVGLTGNYPVFVYRNYTFIKDGVINVKKFYVSTNHETRKYFEEKGIVIDSELADWDGIYGLDISGLPAINRAMAEGNTSATNLCGWIKRENEIMGELKALKEALKVEFDSASPFDTKLISEQQKAFLEANGVDVDKGGVYSPKVDSVDTDDMYIAKSFAIKIKGLSSLPSVKKVVEKMSAGKNRTLSESVVEVGITKYTDFKDSTDDEDMRKLWLNKEIVKLKSELKGLRSNIQKTKFAIILGKKWFDEFESREDNVLMYEDWQFTFVLGEEKVKF